MKLRKPVCLFAAMLLFLMGAMQSNSLFAQRLEREFSQSAKIRVVNPLNEARESVLVYIDKNQLRQQVPAFNEKGFVVMDGKVELASQYNVEDKDYPGLVLVLDRLEANESKELVIRYRKNGSSVRQYPKRTQAEISHKVGGRFENRKYIGGNFKNVDYLRVPDEHTDHSYFIRYEGPGWESDKVGYRLYLDWRNAVDVYGKKVNEPVLQQVGLDGFDSYHNMQPWGMDVLKVAKSLGLGSLAMLHNGQAVRVEKTDSVTSRVTLNGNLLSTINTNYYGWAIAGAKYNLDSRLAIHAGSRLTAYHLTIDGAPENLSTGIIKDKKAKVFTSKAEGNKWGYLATYGAQSLADDKLGLAVLYRLEDLADMTEDNFSHIVKMRPAQGKLTYYFLAAWEQEKDGIKNEAEFLKYLDKTIKELSNPVKIEFVSAL